MIPDANPRPTRRTVLTGACGAACLAAVAGCAEYGKGRPPQAAPAAPAAPQATAGGAAAPAPAANALASTADIPVGGGKIFAAQQVVVTQPTAGTFKAFDTTCTHTGCTVDEVTGGTINCPCHGSMYAIADASVVGGPAPSPLATKAIKVSGTSITLA